MQSPPFPRYLVPPRSKYSPQHHVLKHPLLPFLPQRKRPSFTPILYLNTFHKHATVENEYSTTFLTWFSGFRCGVNEICALSGNLRSAEWKLLAQVSGKTYQPHLQSSSPRPLEMEPTCPETSLRNYPPTLRKIRKESISRYFPLSRHQAWRF